MITRVQVEIELWICARLQPRRPPIEEAASGFSVWLIHSAWVVGRVIHGKRRASYKVQENRD